MCLICDYAVTHPSCGGRGAWCGTLAQKYKIFKFNLYVHTHTYAHTHTHALKHTHRQIIETCKTNEIVSGRET